jgi:hypothetical protein
MNRYGGLDEIIYEQTPHGAIIVRDWFT